MKPILSIIAAALALGALPGAHAAERYAGIAAGLWIPDTGGASIKSELDNGVAGELRAGWRLSDAFALEGSFGGFHAEHDLPPADVTETTLHAVSAWYVLLTGRASMPLGDGAWRIAASAGLGYYDADLKAKQPPPPPTQARASESDTGFHLGASVHYALTERSVVALEYRRVQASPGDVDIDGAALMLVGEYHY